MKHARSDYNRIQDMAEVIEFIRKVAFDHREELPSLAENIDTLCSWLEDRYDVRGDTPIPLDEPVFVVRAKDVVGPGTVLAWANQAEDVGADPAMVAAARSHAQEMLDYQELMPPKVPDMPEQAPCMRCGVTTHRKGRDGEFWCSPECAGG